jgi:hypothetical protein
VYAQQPRRWYGGLIIAGTWGAPICQCVSTDSTMESANRNAGHWPLSDCAGRLNYVMSSIMPLCMCG